MKRGFTLIELLVVIVIIGVLAAIALPMYKSSIDKTLASEMAKMTQQVAAAQHQFYSQNNAYTANPNALDITFPGTVTYAAGAASGTVKFKDYTITLNNSGEVDASTADATKWKMVTFGNNPQLTFCIPLGADATVCKNLSNGTTNDTTVVSPYTSTPSGSYYVVN